MAVKHTKVVSTPDDGTSDVGTDEWNDNHIIDDNTITNDHLVGSIAQSKITSLTSDLTSKAPLASPTFTGTVVLPNVPAIVTTELNLKSPLASPTFTGTVVLPNVPAIVTTQLDLKSPLASPTFTGTVVLPNVPAIVTTQLDLKAPIASPTFTGTVTTSSVDVAGNNIDNIQNLYHDITTDSTVTGTKTISFAEDQLKDFTVTGNVTFTTNNRGAGRSTTIKLVASGADRTITYPTLGSWLGSNYPDGSNQIVLASGKTAILTMTCFGTASSDIVAGYAVEE
jgi:hypothetical protein